MPALAAELVRLPADVIIAAQGNITAVAAKRATSTIPVIFATSDDPVATGLVASFNRPGGNLTGVARLGTELGGKNLELLHAAVAVRIRSSGCCPIQGSVGIEARIKNVQDAAVVLGKTIHVLNASTPAEIDAAFGAVVAQKIGALIVLFEFFFQQPPRPNCRAWLRGTGFPAAYAFASLSTAGGLMSYGDSTANPTGSPASYAARVLKGAKPADLPIQQATKVELILNLKTAKALGLTIPITLLGRADEVIE